MKRMMLMYIARVSQRHVLHRHVTFIKDISKI
jgi:hypothetical protein